MEAPHYLGIAIAGLALGGMAHAGTIYKCTARNAVTYQSMPCGSDAAALRVARFGGAADAVVPPPAADAPMAAGRVKGGPWPKRAIALGMTDDEVLNMPAWGRPARIVRTRLARGSHAAGRRSGRTAMRGAPSGSSCSPTRASRTSSTSRARRLPCPRTRRPQKASAVQRDQRAGCAAGACAYMFDTRAPMGMHPHSSSATARQATIFT